MLIPNSKGDEVKRSVLLSVCFFFAFCTAVSIAATGFAGTAYDLTTEGERGPVGLDVSKPRFSWKMKPEAGKKAQMQTAYRLVLKEAGSGGDTFIFMKGRDGPPGRPICGALGDRALPGIMRRARRARPTLIAARSAITPYLDCAARSAIAPYLDLRTARRSVPTWDCGALGDRSLPGIMRRARRSGPTETGRQPYRKYPVWLISANRSCIVLEG